ncbi:hypothetical protein V8C34DRAFT_280392 [Trichoderma compactum]
MLHGRLGFCFGIVDGPLGGGIRLGGTWREDKVSKQKDEVQESQLRRWIGHEVHEVSTRFTAEYGARTWPGNTEYRYGIQIQRTGYSLLRVWDQTYDTKHRSPLFTAVRIRYSASPSHFRHPGKSRSQQIHRRR